MAESVDCYLYFVTYTLTAAFVACLMVWSGVDRTSVGLQLKHWESRMAIGIVTGAVLLFFQALMHKLLGKSVPLRTTDRFQRGSSRLWVVVFLSGALAEEYWIAFCLVAMRATGHSATTSVEVAAVIFGAIHIAYGYYGALSVAIRGVISALLFLWLGSLIPMVVFHFVGDLGNLYWLRRVADN